MNWYFSCLSFSSARIAGVPHHACSFFFFFWQYWDLNSGPCVCQARTLRLKPWSIPFSFRLFFRKDLWSLPKQAWDHDFPTYTTCIAEIIALTYHAPACLLRWDPANIFFPTWLLLIDILLFTNLDWKCTCVKKAD
jgi:hypothetical protein